MEKMFANINCINNDIVKELETTPMTFSTIPITEINIIPGIDEFVKRFKSTIFSLKSNNWRKIHGMKTRRGTENKNYKKFQRLQKINKKRCHLLDKQYKSHLTNDEIQDVLSVWDFSDLSDKLLML